MRETPLSKQRKATGFSFLDSDDYIERDSLEHFLPYINTAATILMGDAFVENGDVDLSHITETHPMRGREYLEKSVKGS